MAPLQLVRRAPGQNRIRVEDLLTYLSPENLNTIDAQIRKMREDFNCPYTVQDYEGFKELLFNFFAHYQKTIYNTDIKEGINTVNKNNPAGQHNDKQLWRHEAYEFIRQRLGTDEHGMSTAERNAITGREGGAIKIIDDITDGISKFRTQNYVQGVFLDLIEPSDYDTRMRLAEELLKKYGPFLFPGEELLPYYMLGHNLERLIQGFVTHIHGLRREWRY